MKKRMKRRLTLNRETVRALQDSELAQIVGGTPGPEPRVPGMAPRPDHVSNGHSSCFGWFAV